MRVPTHLIRRLEGVAALDKVAKPVSELVQKAVQPTPVRNLLSGTDLGHPLHPLLTDLPIGAWSMSVLLDAVGGRDSRLAADILVGAGIVAAVPTAATGLNDWSDTYAGEQRVGVVHALANVAALGLFSASLAARMAGARSRGRALSVVGFGVLTVGGYLGGHLSYVKGVNVNHTAFEERPEDWVDVCADDDLVAGQPRAVSAGGARVLLVRQRGRVHAMANTCSHLGGPLDEGELRDGCIVCPWHGSTFRLDDGVIVRGPASTPQPMYDVRVTGGRVEVRARA
jgi:nitrite reductase/ring-hydroxylating ferredoxin subunit/uncharacterized membrane protein